MKLLSIDRSKIILLICLVLLIIPIFLQGNNYIVGGDDMKLYYLYPDFYLRNFAFKLIGGNALAGALTGYSSVAYFAPFYIVINLFRLFVPFINTQALLYGLNFSLGFYFFYLQLNLFIPDKSLKTSVIKIFSSLLYVFSPLLSATVYSHQLLYIFLISVIPLVWYLFIKGILSDSIKLTILSILILSFFTTTLDSIPTLAAFALCAMPIFLALFLNHTRKFIKHSFVASIAFLSVNLYWIFHVLYAHFIEKTSTGNAIFASGDFNTENIRIASSVSTLFSPLNQIFLSLNGGNFHFLKISEPLNILYVLIIISGFVITLRRKNNLLRENKLYSSLLVCLVLSWFFLSPNFGTIGPKLFVYLVKTVPGFGMFRNMYDKFSFSFSFFYASVFACALYSLSTKISRKVLQFILILIGIILVLETPPLLNPFIQDRMGLTRVSGVPNEDYLNLLNFLRNQNDEYRVLELPLNAPNYANIEFTNGNTYMGLSPMQILINRQDYSGKFSFLTMGNPFIGDNVIDTLNQGNYKQFGSIISQFNIGYVVVNHNEVSNDMKPFYYGGEKLPLLQAQSEAFYHEILGEKLKDFGNHYSLYKINNAYASSLISSPDAEVTYIKNSEYDYSLVVKPYGDKSTIRFLKPFSDGWKTSIPSVNQNHRMIYTYANEWTISTEPSSKEVNIRLTFIPASYNIYLIAWSTISGAVLLVFVTSFRNKHANKRI